MTTVRTALSRTEPADPGPAGTRGPGHRRRRHSENIPGYAFLSPWLLGLLAITAVPMLLSLYLSFTDYDVLTPLSEANWVGWDNYRQMFTTDPTYWPPAHRELVLTLDDVLLGEERPVRVTILEEIPVDCEGHRQVGARPYRKVDVRLLGERRGARVDHDEREHKVDPPHPARRRPPLPRAGRAGIHAQQRRGEPAALGRHLGSIEAGASVAVASRHLAHGAKVHSVVRKRDVVTSGVGAREPAQNESPELALHPLQLRGQRGL